MGNSIEKYNFETPKFGSFDFSRKSVYIIDNQEKAKTAINDFLRNCNVLYVDCEGHYFGSITSGSLSLVQVATDPDNCFLFDIVRHPQNLSALKPLFESTSIKKVFHDCSGDASILFYHGSIILKNVDDTQVAHKIIEYNSTNVLDKTTGPSLNDLYVQYANKALPSKGKIRVETPGANSWFQRPLHEKLVKYAAVDTFALCEIFSNQERLLNSMSQHIKTYRTLVNKQLSKKIADTSVYPDVTDDADGRGCVIS